MRHLRQPVAVPATAAPCRCTTDTAAQLKIRLWDAHLYERIAVRDCPDVDRSPDFLDRL